MKSISLSFPWDNSPLGRWAESRRRRPDPALSYPARILVRRHHLSPARADLVASLAGLDVGEGR